MEAWEAWSKENVEAPAPFRAAVLHAWLTHVHPFIDENGRLSRAISNLELIRAGYPPIVIKKKDRDIYIEALAESDDGGDLRSFMDLIFTRTDAALTGLEGAAKTAEGYNPTKERFRRLQEQQLVIWTTAVRLLANIVQHYITIQIQAAGGVCQAKIFNEYLELDDYVDLCSSRSISGGWSFILNLQVPAVGKLEKLTFVQPRSNRMYNHIGQIGGPSLYWSGPNPKGYPKWTPDNLRSPYAIEITNKAGSGDEWISLLADGSFVETNTAELATRIASALIAQVETSIDI